MRSWQANMHLWEVQAEAEALGPTKAVADHNVSACNRGILTPACSFERMLLQLPGFRLWSKQTFERWTVWDACRQCHSGQLDRSCDLSCSAGWLHFPDRPRLFKQSGAMEHAWPKAGILAHLRHLLESASIFNYLLGAGQLAWQQLCKACASLYSLKPATSRPIAEAAAACMKCTATHQVVAVPLSSSCHIDACYVRICLNAVCNSMLLVLIHHKRLGFCGLQGLICH